jgi:hypothetical protein
LKGNNESISGQPAWWLSETIRNVAKREAIDMERIRLGSFSLFSIDSMVRIVAMN